MSKQSIRSMIMILLGTFILAFGYYHINFQNDLSDGGFIGLSLLMKYVFNFSPAISVLFLDLPFFVLAFFRESPQFILRMSLGAIAFSLFYKLFEWFSPLVLDFSHTMIVASILSGLVTGLGAGLVLRSGGATGGEDMLCIFASKYTGISIGNVFLILDLIVLGLSFFFLPLNKVLYTILAVFITGKVINWTIRFERDDSQPLHEPMIMFEK
jgi:uncharacterized membrane-anchored protein YitT (DUF2179 family)